MLIEFEVKIELTVWLFVRLSLERLEQFLNAVSGERRLAKDTHDFKHRSANLEILLNDGDETVRDDGNVYLYPNSVLGLTPETLDLKVLLDPVEEELHLLPVSDTLGLCDGDHVECEFLKDAVIPECIGLRQHLPVDGLTAKTEVFGFLSMGNRDICMFPEASASHELTEHQHQHVAPVRHRPSLGPVVVLGHDAPEIPLWKELGYLRENELFYVHICCDFESDANVSFSKPGQGMEKLKRCA